MATIKLRDVSFNYAAPARTSPFKLFEGRRERPQENLPGASAQGMNALESVDLTIPNGQTFVVVGPSGCGKTSLLRVVAGLERNYSGQVLFDGQDMKDVPPGKRQIGIVFQNYALYPNFTSEGNLSFF